MRFCELSEGKSTVQTRQHRHGREATCDRCRRRTGNWSGRFETSPSSLCLGLMLCLYSRACVREEGLQCRAARQESRQLEVARRRHQSRWRHGPRSSFSPRLFPLTFASQASPFSCDVTSRESIDKAFADIKKEYPSSDLKVAVFNSSSPFQIVPFLEAKVSDLQTAYNVSVYVPVVPNRRI